MVARPEDAEALASGEKPAESKPKVKAETVNWLDPAKLLFLWPGGTAPVRMTIEGEKSFLRVYAAYAFPHSDPQRFIQFFEGKPDGGRGDVIGILEDSKQLSESARKAVEEALGRGYVVPKVKRIVEVRDRRWLVQWIVETDRGIVEFEMNDIYEQIQVQLHNRVMLIDVHGNRYEIQDMTKLDPESLAFLNRFL